MGDRADPALGPAPPALRAVTWLRAFGSGLGGLVQRAVVVSLLGVIMGGLASLAATGFVAAIELVNDLVFVSSRSRMMAGDWALIPVLTVAVPAAGGLVVGVLKRMTLPHDRAHGPPDVIEVAQTGSGDVRARRGVPSALAALVSLGSGASVGQYGPLVHLGATIGSVIGRHTPFGGGRTLGTIGLGCGVASAISTAFNAPIAGILFAHEVILRHYSLRAFAPITVASTVGFVLANFVFELRPLFRIDEAPRVIPIEFAGFVAVGIVGAIVAVVFMRAIVAAGVVAMHSRLPAPIRPAVAGALMGVLALWTPEIIGMGKETLRFAIIPEAFTVGELGALLAAKIVATALCLGFGFAGGSFSPALVVGALFGALAGYAAIPVVPGAADSTGVYAICGMAAVTSPVIGGPITTILIVFELTRNYELTTAVMVSVVFANLVCYRLYGRSMYDVMLRRRGCDLSLGRDQLVLNRTPIVSYVSDDYVTARPDEPAERVRQRLVEKGASEAQLVDADGDYHGTITLNAVLAAIARGGGSTAAELASWDVAVLRTRMSVLEALRRAEHDDSGLLPVLAAGGGNRLVGVIAQSAIARAYGETLVEIRREEHASP